MISLTDYVGSVKAVGDRPEKVLGTEVELGLTSRGSFFVL